jgi:hypothetical protein
MLQYFKIQHVHKIPSEKEKTLQEATRLPKDRKAVRIWLMQPNA